MRSILQERGSNEIIREPCENSILVNCDFTVGWSINGIAKNLMASQSILFVHFSVFFYLISSSLGLGDLFTFRFAFDSFLPPSPSSGWSPSASPFWFISSSSRWGESGGKGGGKSKGSSSSNGAGSSLADSSTTEEIAAADDIFLSSEQPISQKHNLYYSSRQNYDPLTGTSHVAWKSSRLK